MSSPDNEDDEKLHEYVSALPKVELHAHLNGCIRETTLLELAQERNVTLSSHFHLDTPHDSNSLSQMYNVKPRSLHDCFELFEDLKQCVNDRASLQRIAREALEDFALQNVVYLELRSTPKRLRDMNKRQYLETILDAMTEFEQRNNHTMESRLIVSIDRSASVADAEENVALAIEFLSQGRVVGVDLGGNPTKHNFRDYQATLETARKAGLQTTVHCGEIPIPEDPTNKAYQEVQAVFRFRPDRLGHALLLPASLREELMNQVRIPVESCPTSNVMTLELAKHKGGNLLEGLQQHPQLGFWLAEKYPISISTDDPGVFHTHATQEMLLLAKAWNVSKERLKQIVLDSIDQAFCEEVVKTRIREKIQEFKWQEIVIA
jgi:adenosine deaminase